MANNVCRGYKTETVLSRELAGLILPHDHFGSHLDDRGCTINDDFEKSNFEFDEKALVEVWNTMNSREHPVRTSYVNSGEHELPLEPQIKRYFDHVQEISDSKMQR